jgi:hypothetical protein
MLGSRASARLQLLIALWLALVCIIHGQLESRPLVLDKNGKPVSRGKGSSLTGAYHSCKKSLLCHR